MLPIVVVTAQISDTAYPDKCLEKIKGRPTIHHLLDRALCGNMDTVLATTDSREDRALRQCGRDREVAVLAGPPEQSKRLLMAANVFNATHVIQIRPENVLVEWTYFDRLARCASDPKVEMAHYPDLPKGFGARIYAVDTLYKMIKANMEGQAVRFRETVLPPLPRHKRPGIDLGLTNSDQLAKLKKVFDLLYYTEGDFPFGLDDVIAHEDDWNQQP